MSKKTFRIASLVIVLVMIFMCSSCGDKADGENISNPDTQNEPTSQVNAGTAAPETTTVPETTTAPETTTSEPGSSIQNIIDTLEGKKFYLAGTMKMTSGDSVDTKMTCDGEDYRLEMNSSQMNLSMCYIDGSPYIVNNASNQYVLFDEAAISSIEPFLSSFSSMGVSISGADMDSMKSMMTDFDQNMDFSAYINDGEFFEFDAKIDEVDYLCSAYKTEFGAIYIYTIDGTLKFIDVYDADGLKQMRMEVSVFIPQVLTPISLNGLSQAASLLNLFGL